MLPLSSIIANYKNIPRRQCSAWTSNCISSGSVVDIHGLPIVLLSSLGEPAARSFRRPVLAVFEGRAKTDSCHLGTTISVVPTGGPD